MEETHVMMFVEGILRVWAGGIGGGRKNIALTAHDDDIRRMASTGTLTVICMNCPTAEGRNSTYEMIFNPDSTKDANITHSPRSHFH